MAAAAANSWVSHWCGRDKERGCYVFANTPAICTHQGGPPDGVVTVAGSNEQGACMQIPHICLCMCDRQILLLSHIHMYRHCSRKCVFDQIYNYYFFFHSISREHTLLTIIVAAVVIAPIMPYLLRVYFSSAQQSLVPAA